MRFEQLKHDPNSVMRKKLVKSKKNWIVVATLSLAGGIFLMGTPSLNVKADTIPTQINAAKSSTTTKSPTDSSTTAQTNTATQSTTVDNNQTSTDATNESKSTANVAESPTTSASTPTDDDDKTDLTNTVETNLAKSKTQLENLGVTPTELSADTNTDTTTNTNIAQGIQGTTPWFISADGSLHLGDSTQTTALADNTTTTTDKVSGSSSTETATTPTTTPAVTPSDTSSTDTSNNTNTTTNTASDTDKSNTTQKQTSTNSDTEQNSSPDDSNSTTSTTNTAPTTSVATSPWQKYANNINNITFDGKVTGAVNMNHMFSDLSNLTTINNVNQLDTSSTENVSGLFANDTKLTTVTGSKTTDGVVDLSDLNLTNLNDTSDMFLDDSSIQDITFPERASTIKKGVNFNYMFKNDISLNALDVSNWQFSYAKTMLGMFQNDKKLKNLSISSWNMDTNPDTGDSSKNEGMFDGTDLQSITLSSANTFKDYTALPSSKSNGWTDGDVAFSAEPNNSDNYNYNLSSVKGSLTLYPTTFTPNSESDPTVPTYTVTLTVPTSLGNQTFTHTGTLNSSFSVTPNTFPGYTPDISTVVATITSTTQATTNYYINYVGNLVNQWRVNGVNSPTGQTMTVTGTTSSTGDPARIGDTFYINPDTTNTGYTVSKVGSGLISADENGNPTYTVLTQPEYVGIDVPESSAQFTTTTGVTKNVTIPEGQYGNTATTIDVPDIPGYTLSADSPKTLQVTYNKNGTSSVDTSKVTYIPNIVASWTVDNVTGPENTTVSASGTTNSNDTTAKIGDTVSIRPDVSGTGYQMATPGTGTITANTTTGAPEIAITTQPTYEPITIPKSSVTFTAASGSTSTVSIPEGKYGNTTASIEVPDIPGYTLSSDSPKNLNVIYNKDGTSSVDISSVKYIPNTVPSWTVSGVVGPDNTTVSASGSTNSNNVTAKIGDTISIAPDVTGTGYRVQTPGIGKIYADPKTGQPEIKITNNPIYIPIPIPSSTQTITTKDGTTIQITTPTGDVTIKNQTVNVPKIPGYTASESTLPISYNKDGSVTVDSSNLTYTPNNVPNWSTTVTDPTGKTIQVSGTNAKVGQTVTLSPNIPGYDTIPGIAVIKANSDGSTFLDIAKAPTYSPTKVPTWSTSVNGPTADSQIKINGTDVHYGQTIILNPNTDNSGYTVNKPGKGVIAIGKDGHFYVSVTQQPSYTANPVKNWQTTISLPNHQTMQVSGNTNSDNQSAKFGDTVTIKPEVPGYQVTPGTGIIVADKNGQPTIQIITEPKFTKIPSTTTQPTVQKADLDISTYPDSSNIPIYQWNYDNMTVLKSQQLAPQTDWFTDQTIVVSGIKYYHIATNEWVKASQVYPYRDLDTQIRTYDKTTKVLYESADQIVGNREIQPNSSWYSDQIAYFIDGEKYYRIADDEFVKDSDAYVYQPTKMTVRVKNDTPIQNLYTAKGELITNRSLVADSDWFVDSIVYINGIKYYRVATDEFVKASDVDTDH